MGTSTTGPSARSPPASVVSDHGDAMRRRGFESGWQVPLGLLVVSQSLGFTTISFQLPFLPSFLSRDLGVTDPATLSVWVGLCAAATPFTVMLCTPLWSRVGGRKATLVRALVGCSVMVGVLGFTQTPWQYLALRLALGTVTAGISATLVMVTFIVPRERMSDGLGWVQVGRLGALTGGPLLGGIAADAVGYRGAHVLVGIVTLATALAAWRLLPDPGQTTRGDTPGGFLAGLQHVRTQPGVLWALGLGFLVHFSVQVVGPYLPLRVAEIAPERGNLATLSGLILSAINVSGAMAGVTIGRQTARWGYPSLLIAGAVVSAVLSLLQALATTPEQLLLLRFVMGFSLGGLTPLLQTLIGVATPQQHRGVMLGLNTSAMACGSLLAPLLGAVVVLGFGLAAPFLTAAGALLLMAGGAWHTVREPDARDEREAPS